MFEATATGITAPITELCDSFDRETRQGRDMSLYDKLLNDVIAHIRQTHNREQTAGLGLSGNADFKLPRASESPRECHRL